MLGVLWVLVGATVIGIAVSLSARAALATAQNRVSLARAQWRAEDCLERVRSTLGDSLTSHAADPGAQAAVWRTLGVVITSAPLLPDTACRVSVHAAGSALDVNTADEEMLRAFFTAVGLAPARVDSLVDALLDWRDSDDVPRPHGAERAWYEAHGRFPPRNGPLADRRELRRVRGFETLPPGIDSLLDVEPGRIPLNTAPLPILAALAGMSDEALARIAEMRASGARITDLLTLAGTLSKGAREVFLAHYPDLVRLTTTEPDAWIVEARGRAGRPPVAVAVELRLAGGGMRAAVVRRRTWITTPWQLGPLEGTP